MKVSEIGEFDLIEILSREVENLTPANVLAGIGDDAAAWRCHEGIQLGTTDMLIEGIHFDLQTTSWYDLGWKALAVNLSDIAAMGAAPSLALVSIGIPPHTAVENVIELYRGMDAIARRYRFAIVGGDTSRAATVVISPTLLGHAEPDRLMVRSAAQPGELIALTGNLGTSAAGLAILSRGVQMDSPVTLELIEAHLKPVPRINEGRMLAQSGVKAAIDISDGLVADLAHICQASGVGSLVHARDIPIHPLVAKRFGPEALRQALTGGEDYQLLFTAPAETIELVKRRLQTPITVIGTIVGNHPGTVTVLDERDEPINLQQWGWDHFGRT